MTQGTSGHDDGMPPESRAGQPATQSDLVDVDGLLAAYYDREPDPEDPEQQVAFGTSGHRGSALTPRSTSRTSSPSPRRSASTGASRAPTARCSSAATRTRCPSRRGRPRSRCCWPTTSRCSSTAATATRRPRRSRTRSCGQRRPHQRRRAWPTGSWSPRRTTRPATAASSTTRRTAARPTPTPPVDRRPRQRADPRAGCATSAGSPTSRAPAATTSSAAYVDDLPQVLDLDAIREAGVRIGADPLGGASVDYWGAIGERYGLDLTVVNPEVDPTWRVHDARLGRQDPDGLLVAVRHGVADRAQGRATTSRPATTPTPTGTASSRPTPG